MSNMLGRAVNFPLLGAIAASFKIISDERIYEKLDIHIALVSPSMVEIYINPKRRLSQTGVRLQFTLTGKQHFMVLRMALFRLTDYIR